MRTLRFRAVSAGLACLLVAAGSLATPPTYVATPVVTLGGGANNAAGIGAGGHVVGASYVSSNAAQHAYLFAGGAALDLGLLNGSNSHATAVNRHAQVTGNGDDGAVLHGFLYSGGTLRRLAAPQGTYATAINDRGQIAGQYPSPSGVGNAFVITDGTLTDLGGLESWGGSTAYAINNLGQAAGSSYAAGGNLIRAFRHANGVMADLGPPGVPLNSQAFSINEAGQVTGGGALANNGGFRAFISTNGGLMVPLPPMPGGADSDGRGINNAGQVVGVGYLANAAHAFLYEGGVMYDLNARVTGSGLGGRVIRDAAGINDSGQIAVNACEPVFGVCQAFRLDPLPGTATVSANPYGALTVSGGTLVGNLLSLSSAVATLQLGNVSGGSGTMAVIDFDGLNLAPGSVLTVISGAPDQTVVLASTRANATGIAGSIVAAGSPGVPPPVIVVRNPAGIAVATEGRITAPAGLVLDALGASWTTGNAVVNFGVVDGGASLRVMGAAANGAGTYKGNAIEFATFGNLNNPVNGARYLANGLALAPSSGNAVALTVNDYGPGPQFINLAIAGNATLAIPSAWPQGSTRPVNNAPVLPGEFRAAGLPDPLYGGSSIIVQASGTLALDGGTRNDLVFPGGVVLKAGVAIDFKGVTVDNGWTTGGKAFQGQFYEAPLIVSNGPIDVRTSDLNWINFSTRPAVPVRAWQLRRTGNGAAQFTTADNIAPHVNTYSVLIEAAAAGNCWVCLMDQNPANLY